MYDYLIVGAGLYGAVFAYEAAQKGKSVLVIDRRDHIAGNAYCKNVEGIPVHWYGAHIFHTSDKTIWEFVNRFAEFNNYINSPVAVYKDELYNLPFNMNTFSRLWNIKTPQEAKDIIAAQIAKEGVTEPKNLEEQAISMVGRDVFEKLVKLVQYVIAIAMLPLFFVDSLLHVSGVLRMPPRFNDENSSKRFVAYILWRFSKVSDCIVTAVPDTVCFVVIVSSVRFPYVSYFALGDPFLPEAPEAATFSVPLVFVVRLVHFILASFFPL